MSETNGNGNATALAVQEAGKSTAIEQIRQRGAAQIAERKLLGDMYRMLQGVEWGISMSEASRAAFAKFCVVTRANPQLHVDLLGGKPYLNAQYYRDKVSADAYFIDDEQINISPSMSEQLRAQAKQALQEARDLGLPEPTQEVQLMLQEARSIDRRRAEYGVPEWATHVYETVIRRYTENAPLDAIRRGDIDGSEFVRVVRECNWAGGRNGKDNKKDPIGDAEPAKTARSRSFRRAARNAFSAWFDEFDDEIGRALQVLEAEFEIVQEDRAAAARQLPSGTDDQVLRTGGGEAQGVSGQEVARQEQQQNAEPEPFDKVAAQRALFATLRDAGITEDQRKEWAKDNDLPPSTKLWEQGHFERAMEILIAPYRTKLEQGCAHLGVTPDALAHEVFGRPVTILKEIQQLISECGQRLDAVAAQDGDL